jgi:hypothetical protein
MGEVDVQSERLRQALVRGEFLAVSSVRVFRIPSGIGLKARTAALFKAAAVLSCITFARKNFVFRSTNVAI